MAKADRVLSTPPTNTSPIHEANPPPEARAESVDSFSRQPAIGQPGSGKLTGESGKPAEGLSRRILLGAIAALPVVPAAAAATSLSPPDGFELFVDDRGRAWFKAVDEAPDPIFAAIEKHKQAAAAWDAAVDVRSNFNDLHMTEEQREQRWELDDAVEDAWTPCEQAGIDLVNTEPTTQAGIIAAITYIRIQMLDDGIYMPHGMEFEFNPGNEGDAKETMAWIDAFLGTIVRATAALSGVQS